MYVRDETVSVGYDSKVMKIFMYKNTMQLVVKIIPYVIITAVLIYAAIQTYMAQTQAAVMGDTGSWIWYYIIGGIIVLVWAGTTYVIFKKEIDEYEKNNK